MHAHDRTLIASLGFADPDKNSAVHDLGCQYLALPENHARLGRMLLEGNKLFPKYNSTRAALGFASDGRRVTVQTVGRLAFDHPAKPVMETPIVKGEGKYRTIVGFIDVCLPYVARWSETATWEGADAPGVWREDTAAQRWTRDGSTAITFPLCVEVKSGAVHVGEVLRQVALYREFERDPVGYMLNDRTLNIPIKWVLASRCHLSEADIATLRDAGVTHVRLGPAFDKWLAERPTDKGESPEF